MIVLRPRRLLEALSNMEKAFDVVRRQQASNASVTVATIDELIDAVREYQASALDAVGDVDAAAPAPRLARLRERAQRAAPLLSLIHI